MIDTQTIATVKSTIPLIVSTGPKLTAHFYQRMFQHNPELKDIFNMSHQINGAQREALFNAICAYAANIDNVSALLPAVEKIAHKHASLNIKPEHYSIVGRHLLHTIDELFQPGKEIIDAWAKAFDVLADIFINREEQIYKTNEENIGGWRGLRRFKVAKKIPRSETITSFQFIPADGNEIVDFLPGQYLTIYLQDRERLTNQQIRQYSLTNAPNGENYCIAVKREEKGSVSNYLHNNIKEGDIVKLAPPCGDFFLAVNTDTPVTLISAGVGLTPMISMLEKLQQQQHKAPLNWLHATEHGGHHAFANEVKDKLTDFIHGFSAVWYNKPREQDRQPEQYQYQGLMNLSKVKQQLNINNMHYYFCGPVNFMQFIAKQLLAMGVNTCHIHYECFGPHKVIEGNEP
ncbi:NO-inducible flavohemoprotein [Arsenophonus sp. aPb]|uniref:NO-inducible flavohemoprotein n=1 Tax=Arsenophonus sp. aPb TaxID=3041619 RepID=UPI00246895E5|nr:NO-inducible flavohemoprotein [Arsenophonus sp. aPb]WGL97504.1 NO-inducible flavohemoprotein [Arsenophonus sp. aPb]